MSVGTRGENLLKVLRTLYSDGPVSTERIARSVNLTVNEVAKHLDELVNTGHAERVGLAPFRYKLTVEGEAVVLSFLKLGKEQVLKITGVTPFSEGFHFYRDIGQYTGISVTSIKDFLEVLKSIDIKSLEFHVKNTDFEKWFRFLGDDELADDMRKISKLGLSGEPLREKILTEVKNRTRVLTFLADILRSQNRHP